MDSIRQNKINKLISRELAEIFRCESKSIFEGAFISVTQVRVSPDLGSAKVYISILGKEKEKTMKLVVKQKTDMRRRLGMAVGKQMRAIPELQFYLDDSLDYAMNIERLLKK